MLASIKQFHDAEVALFVAFHVDSAYAIPRPATLEIETDVNLWAMSHKFDLMCEVCKV